MKRSIILSLEYNFIDLAVFFSDDLSSMRLASFFIFFFCAVTIVEKKTIEQGYNVRLKS